MNKTLAISAIVLIAVVMVVGSVSPALADKGGVPNEGNNGNNGCENSNAKSKACEKNPNTTPEPPVEPEDS